MRVFLRVVNMVWPLISILRSLLEFIVIIWGLRKSPMAHYTLPTFNLNAYVWRTSTYPAPPDFNYTCQLYLDARNPMGANADDGYFEFFLVYARFPRLTDIRPGDFLELPGGSGRTYSVQLVEDAHKGFVNEYRIAVISIVTQPFPLP